MENIIVWLCKYAVIIYLCVCLFVLKSHKLYLYFLNIIYNYNIIIYIFYLKFYFLFNNNNNKKIYIIIMFFILVGQIKKKKKSANQTNK